MRILIASSIHAEAIEHLRAEHDVVCAFNAPEDKLKAAIRDRDTLIFRSGVQISAEVMACAPNLKLLLRAGSGVDNIDLEYVEVHGLELVRIPSPGAKAVAELAFGLMLGLSRNLLECDRLIRQGRWAKHEIVSYLLTGKTLGIVGVGNIGTLVAQRGAAWDMEVLGCVANPTPVRAVAFGQKGIRLTDLGEVLERSDYVSLHVPLTGATRGLIDAAALARMKRGSYLINLARGGVVDEAALAEALARGHLRGAALDVHGKEGDGVIPPLAAFKNVILTPHVGAETLDSQREIGDIVVRTISDFARRHPVTSVQPAGARG